MAIKAQQPQQNSNIKPQTTKPKADVKKPETAVKKPDAKKPETAVKKPGEETNLSPEAKAKKAHKGKKNHKPEDKKDPKKLDDKVKDLEKQINDMKNNPQANQAQPGGGQPGGGAPGGGAPGGGAPGGGDAGGGAPGGAAPAGGAAPMGDQQQQGPDADLSNLAAQVLQSSGMGMPGQFPQQGFQNFGGQQPGGPQGIHAGHNHGPQGINGRPGFGGPQGFGGRPGFGGPQANNPQTQALKGQLQQKAMQYAQGGFQPQQQTRVLVQSALGYDPFQQQQQQQMAGIPGMGGPQFGGNQFGGNPLGQFRV